MLKRFAILVIGLVLVVGLIVQARRMDNSISKTKADAAAEGHSHDADVRAEGWVVTYPGAQVTVGTDVAGTIIRMPVEEKSVVRKGALIAELRADDTRAALEESRSQVKQSEADIRLYEIEVSRTQQLFDEKVGTRQALDRAVRDRDAALAHRETALATVRKLEAVLDKTRIYAPISGVVLSRLVQPGETVKEGASLVTIANLDRARIEAEVDEFDAGRVQVGDEVRITAEGFAGEQWHGRVEEVPDSVVGRRLKPQDPTKPIDTRVLLVKVAFAEATPLKLGQKVEVEIGAATSARAYEVVKGKRAQ